jgi:hypothetical protein
MSCAYISEWEVVKEISQMEIFSEPETGRVSFKPGTANQLDFSQLQTATVALLPVRSTLGGGLGEERVTKHFYENLARRFTNLKFIGPDEASDLFTDLEIWEDYFEYLIKYQQSSVSAADFDKLKGLYRQLGADYIININSDPAFIPRYPGNFTVFIQVQIWDISNGKMVWEGFGQGEDVVLSAETLERVREKMIDWTCQRLVEEMGHAHPLADKAGNRISP